MDLQFPEREIYWHLEVEMRIAAMSAYKWIQKKVSQAILGLTFKTITGETAGLQFHLWKSQPSPSSLCSEIEVNGYYLS